MRISEETNKKVDDQHLSEKGHQQLAKDLINEIKKYQYNLL
jgi:lysophospholipase L1-like esterase